MYSVTQRIRNIQQPYGGYLPIRSFQTTPLNDGQYLFPWENIHASLVGLSVDYLTRFMGGTPADKAFMISLMGAYALDCERNKQTKDSSSTESQNACFLLNKITGLDDDSIFHACQLVGYDVCFRAGSTYYQPVSTIKADSATIHNIRIMVQRSLRFLEHYGPVVKDGFSFEGGYTHIVSTGDGDFITEDTMWDFKVIKSKPSSRDTLQLLMYYLMGRHSVHPELHKIQKLGFFNPRSNIVFLLDTSKIPEEVISEVERDVICYNPLPKEDAKPAVLPKSTKRNRKTADTVIVPTNDLYPIGTEIDHPIFGRGTVEKLQPCGNDHLIHVRFVDTSRKFFTSTLNRILHDS